MGESETPKKPSFASHGNGNNHTKHSNMSDSVHGFEHDGPEEVESLAIFEETEIEEVIQAPRGPTGRGQAEVEALPDVLYRFKMLHSSETFFGYYEPAKLEDYAAFRTLAELEAMLKAPISASVVQPGAAGSQTATTSSQSEVTTTAVDALDPAQNSPSEDAQEPPEIAAPAAPRFIPPRSLAIAPTKYGKDIVEIQGRIFDTSFVNADELILIERPATVDDIRRMEENLDKEKAAYELCREKIWARNLPMKLVSAHYLLDEPKILFYFTADSRVDFRELVKDLVAAFKMRIELRQIGVRDEARVTGGCGVCGRVLCCHGVSDKLNPVSIKMAKDQNLSLNSLKISGPCGRLLCCLSYEYQFYKDARRELPQEGIKFTYDETLFRVVEVNALTGTVKLAGEDGRVLDMKADRFRYSEGRWRIIDIEE